MESRDRPEMLVADCGIAADGEAYGGTDPEDPDDKGEIDAGKWVNVKSPRLESEFAKRGAVETLLLNSLIS